MKKLIFIILSLVAINCFAESLKVGTVFSTEKEVGAGKLFLREYHPNKSIILVLKNITEPSKTKAAPAAIRARPGVCQWYRGGIACGVSINGQSTEFLKNGRVDRTVLILCKSRFPIITIPLFAAKYVYKMKVIGISSYEGNACPKENTETKSINTSSLPLNSKFIEENGASL